MIFKQDCWAGLIAFKVTHSPLHVHAAFAPNNNGASDAAVTNVGC